MNDEYNVFADTPVDPDLDQLLQRLGTIYFKKIETSEFLRALEESENEVLQQIYNKKRQTESQ